MKKKRLWIAVAVVGILVVLVVLNSRRKGGAPAVQVTRVRYGSLESTVRADGTVRAQTQVDIGADVMGRILRIPVAVGDTVRAGDTLCLIDPSTWLAKLREAEARLHADLYRLEKLARDYDRTRKLYEQNLVSRASLEEIQTQYRALKAQVRMDSFMLEEARSTYAKTIITSPVDGVVLSVNKEPGEMVVVGTINTPGSVILRVAKLDTLLVEAGVDETEIVRVRVGQPVRIRVDAFPDTVFQGRVVRIAGSPGGTGNLLGSTGGQGVSYPVRVLVEGSPPLLPGMNATCEIVVARRDSTLVIPFTAVGRRKVEGRERDVVFRITGGRAVLTPVKLGVASLREVEVVHGLQAGDTVAVGPFKVLKTLEDSTEVTITWASHPGEE